MDDFMQGEFQPLLQTSRLCPYMCAFCVSGKTRGKLRAFPVDQVKEEIDYVAASFKDRPHFTYYIADENFGILSRDIEIAEHLKNRAITAGYPKNVFFYNDKRFTETSRSVIDALGDINTTGLTLALQSENPESLKAINRKNLTSEQIDAAIAWAVERNLPVTTEMIFGLPYETRQSFTELLERCVRRGFDSILCHNLFVMDGIEMNRPAYREAHKMETMFRVLTSSYGSTDLEFTVESEEVVTSTGHFSFEDFSLIRCLNFMLYTVYTLNFQKFFFNYLREIDVSTTDFFTAFVNPDPNKAWPAAYLEFIQDFKKAYNSELFSSKEDMVKHVQDLFVQNGHQVAAPTRINVNFGARLIWLERPWTSDCLKTILSQFYDLTGNPGLEKRIDLLLAIGDRQWIDLECLTVPEPIVVDCDLIQWKEKKFKLALPEMPARKLTFKLNAGIEDRACAFNKDFGNEKREDYYYHALDFFGSRCNLLYDLSYHAEAEVTSKC